MKREFAPQKAEIRGRRLTGELLRPYDGRGFIKDSLNARETIVLVRSALHIVIAPVVHHWHVGLCASSAQIRFRKLFARFQRTRDFPDIRPA